MTARTTRVLIVSRAFPPFAATLGGAIRVLKLAEFLLSRNLEVHVLAGRGRHYGTFGFDELLSRIHVHFVDDPVLARTGPVIQATGQGETSARGSALRTVLRVLVNEFSLPDAGVFALPRLVREGRRIVSTHAIDHVITSGPPHSDHLVGLALKRRFRDRLGWIVDYRDSWNGTSLFRKTTWPMRRLSLLLEKNVLEHADHFTFISPPMLHKADVIAGKRTDLAAKAHLIMNGFDASVVQPVRPWVSDGGPLRIGYFGSIDDRPDSYRNPTPLFEVVLARSLDVRFDIFGQARLSPRWQERLGARFKFGGIVTQAEAFRCMMECDVLLLLHTRHDGADEVITGKFFEYLLASRPVLSVGPSNMAVNQLIAETGVGHCVPHDDPARLHETLSRLVELKRAGQLPNRPPADISRFSRTEQYKAFLPLLAGRQ